MTSYLVCNTAALQRNGKIQRGNSCRRMVTLFEIFCAVFLFIWSGNAVPFHDSQKSLHSQ